MRPIHLAAIDKTRPVVLLTPEQSLPWRTSVTVAPITSRIRGTASEVPVGTSNGLESSSVINCDSIETIGIAALGRRIGFLLEAQEADLVRAIVVAFDLAVEELP